MFLKSNSALVIAPELQSPVCIHVELCTHFSVTWCAVRQVSCLQGDGPVMYVQQRAAAGFGTGSFNIRAAAVLVNHK